MKHVGDLTVPSIAAIYAQVPADHLERFQAYRRNFPYQELIHDQVTWSYMTGGHGEPPLLLLTGALTIPDISWTSIVSHAARRRVIVPSYPPVTTMDALVDGVAAILRREGVTGMHVVGGSYGGLVAQVFVRRHPQMTRSLVLSHTQPPSPERAVQVRRSAQLVRLLPMGLVRRLMRRSFRSLLPEWSAETACLLAIYDEIIGHALDKEAAVAILARAADYSAHTYTPQDLSGWPRKVLLVFGEDDPATPPDLRERLESLYPGCRVHTFAGSGHTTSVTRQDESLAVIDGFLSQA